jgi:hypothetical protein
MMLTTLDIGSKIDILNQHEMREVMRDAQRADAELRAALVGVKPMDKFYGVNVIGAAVQAFTTPNSMVAAGYMWAVMNMGFELSAAGVTRVYKGSPPQFALGSGRFVGQTASTATNSLTFSKGQLMLRTEDVLTIQVPGAGNLLSVFISAIEVPAERVGELLL